MKPGSFDPKSSQRSIQLEQARQTTTPDIDETTTSEVSRTESRTRTGDRDDLESVDSERQTSRDVATNIATREEGRTAMSSGAAFRLRLETMEASNGRGLSLRGGGDGDESKKAGKGKGKAKKETGKTGGAEQTEGKKTKGASSPSKPLGVGDECEFTQPGGLGGGKATKKGTIVSGPKDGFYIIKTKMTTRSVPVENVFRPGAVNIEDEPGPTHVQHEQVPVTERNAVVPSIIGEAFQMGRELRARSVNLDDRDVLRDIVHRIELLASKAAQKMQGLDSQLKSGHRKVLVDELEKLIAGLRADESIGGIPGRVSHEAMGRFVEAIIGRQRFTEGNNRAGQISMSLLSGLFDIRVPSSAQMKARPKNLSFKNGVIKDFYVKSMGYDAKTKESTPDVGTQSEDTSDPNPRVRQEIITHGGVRYRDGQASGSGNNCLIYSIAQALGIRNFDARTVRARVDEAVLGIRGQDVSGGFLTNDQLVLDAILANLEVAPGSVNIVFATEDSAALDEETYGQNDTADRTIVIRNQGQRHFVPMIREASERSRAGSESSESDESAIIITRQPRQVQRSSRERAESFRSLVEVPDPNRRPRTGSESSETDTSSSDDESTIILTRRPQTSPRRRVGSFESLVEVSPTDKPERDVKKPNQE